MIVKVGEKKSDSVQGASLSGFSYKFYLVGTTVNVALTAPFVDLTKIPVRATLKRNKATEVLFSDTLKPLSMESCFFNADFESALANASAVQSAQVIQTQTAGLVNIVMVSVRIDFGTTINVKGDDVLQFDVDFQPSSLGAGINSTLSYVEVDYNDSIGLEFYTPIINSSTIAPGQSRVQESLGSSVTSVAFINMDIVSATLFGMASNIQSLSFDSDKRSFTDDIYELNSKRDAMFNTRAEANGRFGSFLIHRNPQELDNVNLDLLLVAGSTTAGNNVIVWRTFKTSPEQFSNAQATASKHQIENMKSSGLLN